LDLRRCAVRRGVPHTLLDDDDSVHGSSLKRYTLPYLRPKVSVITSDHLQGLRFRVLSNTNGSCMQLPRTLQTVQYNQYMFIIIILIICYTHTHTHTHTRLATLSAVAANTHTHTTVTGHKARTRRFWNARRLDASAVCNKINVFSKDRMCSRRVLTGCRGVSQDVSSLRPGHSSRHGTRRSPY
jgi:hypothetical protein